MYRPTDYIQQIAEYVKKNSSKGYTVESLKVALTKQGYSRIAIERGIELAHIQLAEKAPPMKEKPEIIRRVIPETIEPEQGVFSSFTQFFKRFFG